MPALKITHPRLVAHFDAVDPVIADLARAAGPCTLGREPRPTCFESLASAIASQQISGAVARRILERLVALHEGSFPTPGQITQADTARLRAVGFSFAKIAALKDLAAKTLEGIVPDDDTAATLADEALIDRLVTVRGIGRWSAQMLLMFQLGRPDVLPADDFGVRNGFRLAYRRRELPPPRALLAWGERWSPWRSAAAWYLWRAVDLHAAGTLPARRGPPPRLRTPGRRRRT